MRITTPHGAPRPVFHMTQYCVLFHPYGRRAPHVRHSPNLSLPLIQAAQAQKHVTHNEAVELLDMIVQLTVQAFDATTPPAQAGEGQAWALGASPTGVWASQGGQIASWRGGGWIFAAPQIGWQAWGVAEGAFRVYTGNGRKNAGSEAAVLTHDGAGHQLKPGS